MAPEQHEGEEILWFVQEFGGSSQAGGHPAITLTASAAAAQVRSGEHALSVDDFVDRRTVLLSRQRDYLAWQLDWLKRLANSSGVSSEPCHAAFGYLKNPMDSVVACSVLLRGAVQRAKPAEVVYVGPAVGDEPDPWHGSHMQFWPQLGDRPLADRLLPLVCSHLAVPFRQEYWRASGDPVVRTWSPLNLRAAIRHTLSLTYNFSGAGSWRRRGSASVILWAAGYGVRSVARAEHARHHRVIVLDRRQPFPALTQVLPIGRRRLSPGVDKRIPEAEQRLSEEHVSLLDELDQWTKVPFAGRILESRLATYVDRVCPVVERIAGELEPALRQADVVKVIATNPYGIEEYGCLVAASRIAGIERLLVQHGDHAYPYDFWLATETQNFDRMACSDPTVPADMSDAGATLGCPVPILDLWAPRLDGLVRRQHRKAQGRQRPICYLPTMATGDATLLVGCGFDDTWYFRWQLALLQTMGEHPNIPFVWKAVPPSSLATSDPLVALIAAVPNVRYEIAPFTTLAHDVAALITDFSSTGLYEALAIGLPVLAISFTRFEDIRPRARQALGTVLQSCDDIPEGQGAVRRFLALMSGSSTVSEGER